MAKFRSTAEKKAQLVFVLTVVAMVVTIFFLPNVNKPLVQLEKVTSKFATSEKVLERRKRFSDINSR